MFSCNKVITVVSISLFTLLFVIARTAFNRINTLSYPEGKECKKIENFISSKDSMSMSKDHSNRFHNAVSFDFQNLANNTTATIQEKCPKYSWSSETVLVINGDIIASTSYMLFKSSNFISDCHNKPLYYIKNVFHSTNNFSHFKSLEEVYDSETDTRIGYIFRKSYFTHEYLFLDREDRIVAKVDRNMDFITRWRFEILDASSPMADLRLVYLGSLQHYFEKLRSSDWCNEISLILNIGFYIWIGVAVLWIVYISYNHNNTNEDADKDYSIEDYLNDESYCVKERLITAGTEGIDTMKSEYKDYNRR